MTHVQPGQLQVLDFDPLLSAIVCIVEAQIVEKLFSGSFGMSLSGLLEKKKSTWLSLPTKCNFISLFARSELRLLTFYLRVHLINTVLFFFLLAPVQKGGTFQAEKNRTAFEVIEEANNDEANLRGEIFRIYRVSFFSIRILFLYANVKTETG